MHCGSVCGRQRSHPRLFAVAQTLHVPSRVQAQIGQQLALVSLKQGVHEDLTSPLNVRSWEMQPLYAKWRLRVIPDIYNSGRDPLLKE